MCKLCRFDNFRFVSVETLSVYMINTYSLMSEYIKSCLGLALKHVIIAIFSGEP